MSKPASKQYVADRLNEYQEYLELSIAYMKAVIEGRKTDADHLKHNREIHLKELMELLELENDRRS